MMVEKFEVQESLLEKGYDVIKVETDYYDCSNRDITIIKIGLTKEKAEKIVKLLNE